MAYAVAPLLCALLFLFSQGSALSRENLQITLYVDPAVGDGPSRNSVFSVGAGGFGSIYMRDRPMLDGLGRKANVVGRMMDTNFRTSVTAPSKNIWSISLNLVFDDASRFSGSTLQVAGINTAADCEWSIVGGTGKFTMARGFWWYWYGGTGLDRSSCKLDKTTTKFYIFSSVLCQNK